MIPEIRPSSIDATKHFYGAFGHCQTEFSAGWIVRFCQQRTGDNWRPFTRADLLAFYQPLRLAANNKHIEQKNASMKTRFDDAVASEASFIPEYNQIPRETSCNEEFYYRGLLNTQHRWLYVAKDGLIHITRDFVLKCFQSSPIAACIDCSPDFCGVDADLGSKQEGSPVVEA